MAKRFLFEQFKFVNYLFLLDVPGIESVYKVCFKRGTYFNRSIKASYPYNELINDKILKLEQK